MTTAEHPRHDGTWPADPTGPFASSWRRRHLTVDERVARGRAARREVPRSSLGPWQPAADRPDPIALLEDQAATRLPDLIPIRYGRMLVSPFTFYRGAALIMAADLAATPVTGVTVQLCGDAHLSNFGLFGTPERQMLFDINDFAIASYLGKGEPIDRAIADFSVAYADQNERDYAAFAAAIDSGRLVAQTGV